MAHASTAVRRVHRVATSKEPVTFTCIHHVSKAIFFFFFLNPPADGSKIKTQAPTLPRITYFVHVRQFNPTLPLQQQLKAFGSSTQNRRYTGDGGGAFVDGRQAPGLDRFTVPGIRWCISTTPPGAIFPSPIARQPRGCQYGTVRFREALGDTFPTSSLFGTDTMPTAVEISTMESRPSGV